MQAVVLKKFGIDSFDPGRFEKYPVPLTGFEVAAGMVFDAVFHKADVLPGGAATGIEGEVDVRGYGAGPRR